MTFECLADMLARLVIVLYICQSVRFLINHPDLVLMTLLSLELVLLSIGAFVFSCFCSFFTTVFLCSLSFASPS